MAAKRNSSVTAYSYRSEGNDAVATDVRVVRRGGRGKKVKIILLIHSALAPRVSASDVVCTLYSALDPLQIYADIRWHISVER